MFSHPASATEAFIALFLYQCVVINVLLGVFNLWPIPPLDGANALRYLAERGCSGETLPRFMIKYIHTECSYS